MKNAIIIGGMYKVTNMSKSHGESPTVIILLYVKILGINTNNINITAKANTSDPSTPRTITAGIPIE